MLSTTVEFLLAPALVVLCTITARRYGERAGGVVSAFPAIVGPVLLIAALAHGASFAATAANGTLLGLVSLAAFALVYARLAQRRGWRASLAAGWACAALAGLVAGLIAGRAPAPAGLVAAVLSLAAAWRALPPAAFTPSSVRGSLLARAATAAGLVALLSAAADELGALVGGMLAALPVLACVLAVFTHREQGAMAVIGLLRGMLAGMIAFVIFCQVIAMLIVPYGIGPAFGAAAIVAGVVQALAVYSVHSTLRRQSSAASTAVAAAADSLGRQSS